LRLVHWVKSLFALEFNSHSPFYDEIGPKATVEFH